MLVNSLWWIGEAIQLNILLTHLPLDKMAAILQTIFSNAFSWMKSFVFWLTFHLSLFLRVQLVITQHWFRYWLGTYSAPSHYLNQCWHYSLTHTCGTRGRWVKSYMDTFYPLILVDLWIHLITQTPVSGSCCLPLGALQSMWATWCKI